MFADIDNALSRRNSGKSLTTLPLFLLARLARRVFLRKRQDASNFPRGERKRRRAMKLQSPEQRKAL